mmetsp:Transcript_125821/g.245408  ORF Transcript_125821/g.245408 Transcript_125821/m.245408 type:complete len:648 (+) Transcript_125821:43-1986(+)
MPGPHVPACCALELRGPEERLLLQASGDAQGGDIQFDNHWHSWLRDWEDRQSAQLDKQRRVIVETVEATRDAILEHSEQNITKQMIELKKELRAELEIERSIRCALQAALASNPSGTATGLTNGIANNNKPRTSSDSTTSANNGKKSKVRFEDDVDQAVHPEHAVRHLTCAEKTEMDEALALACGAAVQANRRARASGTSIFDEDPLDGSRSGLFGPVLYKATFQPRLQCQKALARVVHTHTFNVIATSIIIAYTVAIGVQTELDMQQAIRMENPLRWLYFMDMVFTVLFATELILRITCELEWFFFGPCMAWNIFDFMVVTCNVIELANAVQVNLGFLRVIRTLRAARALRLMRIFRIFRQLRLMTASIMSSMTSLVWAFLLMLIVMYIFAVILLQGAADFLRDQKTNNDPNMHAIRAEMKESFGSIAKTTFSLTQAVSGGRSWGEYADIFMEISVWYGAVFGVFIVFMVFGVLNILTGLFVESTRNLATYDTDLVIQEELSQRESTINQIRELFAELDMDQSGTISLQELQDNLNDERVTAYFSLLNLDVTEAEGLFHLLDTDGSGEVSIVEFIMSCMRLKGQARSIDMASMKFETKRMWRMVDKSLCKLDRDLTNLAFQIHSSIAIKNFEAMDQTFECTDKEDL